MTTNHTTHSSPADEQQPQTDTDTARHHIKRHTRHVAHTLLTALHPTSITHALTTGTAVTTVVTTIVVAALLTTTTSTTTLAGIGIGYLLSIPVAHGVKTLAPDFAARQWTATASTALHTAKHTLTTTTTSDNTHHNTDNKL